MSPDVQEETDVSDESSEEPDDSSSQQSPELKKDLPFFSPPRDAKLLDIKPVIKAMGGTTIENVMPGQEIEVRFLGRYAKVIGVKDEQDEEEVADEDAVSKKVPMIYRGLQRQNDDEYELYVEVGDGVFASGVISRGINVNVFEGDQDEEDDADVYGFAQYALIALLGLLLLGIVGGAIFMLAV